MNKVSLDYVKVNYVCDLEYREIYYLKEAFKPSDVEWGYDIISVEHITCEFLLPDSIYYLIKKAIPSLKVVKSEAYSFSSYVDKEEESQ